MKETAERVPLYEKAGFRTVGVHPNAVRMSDGALRHEYLMIKEIE